MNLETSWYLYTSEDVFELFYILRFEKKDKRKKTNKELGPNGVGSIPIGIPISCLKTLLPIAKKHLFMRKDIAMTRVCLAKYNNLYLLELLPP